MRRLLTTFATGEHELLLELALPRFVDYADRHGYEFRCVPPVTMLRPPSWMKVHRLIGCLGDYDEVLWLDADVVIVDGDRDVADDVPADAWQALVRHHTADGEVPNCGVWLLRPSMEPVLERLWTMTRYRHHPWWEQAGMLDLLGYDHRRRPVELAAPTELYRRTCWLELAWNSHEQSDRHPSPRFAHATCGSIDWREQVMRGYLARAEELALRP